jgi:hypothetical protein
MAGKLFGKGVRCTIGNDSEMANTIHLTGAECVDCSAHDIVVDANESDRFFRLRKRLYGIKHILLHDHIRTSQGKIRQVFCRTETAWDNQSVKVCYLTLCLVNKELT